MSDSQNKKESKKDKNQWIKVLALAMSLPSTIIFLAWGLFWLVDKGYLNRYLAFSIFVLVIANTFYLMIRYAKQKNKRSS